MRIHGITEAFGAHFRRVQDSKRPEKSGKNAQRVDASELSSAAKKLNKDAVETSAVEAQVRVQPEIREERVNEVRQKIQDGYYDTAQFQDALAEKLIKDFGWSDTPV